MRGPSLCLRNHIPWRRPLTAPCKSIGPSNPTVNSSSTQTSTFQPLALVHGTLLDLEEDPHPGRLAAWQGGALSCPADGAHFGFVTEGTAELCGPSGTFTLSPGMYFCATGEITVSGGGSGIVITRIGHDALFQLGGPVESRGRLRYIDGCTDSLLVAPTLLGDPCLNLLHIPANTRQSQHTHPSHRIGVIIRGTGRCVTPEGATPLFPGLVFCIHAQGQHSFHTEDEDLLVLAYHPDSDFGPSHEDHPMINRTVLPAPQGSPR